MLKKVRAFAPATIANINCGFDILGMALEKPGDEVIVKRTPDIGIKLNSFSSCKSLSNDPDKNCVTIPIIHFLKHINLYDKIGIEVELIKNLPLGSGMGSSAASSVAGVFAVNHLLGEPLKRKELMPFILEGEAYACGTAHADNAAPSLLGGVQLVRSYEPLDIIEIEYPDKLHVVLIHPDMRIDTITARELMPQAIPMNLFVKQTGNLAGLITGLMRSDDDLIKRSLEDFVAEPVRKTLIPFFDSVKSAAIGSGALGFGISGSGPSLFALCSSSSIAEGCSIAIAENLNGLNIKHQVYVSKISKQGALILEEE